MNLFLCDDWLYILLLFFSVTDDTSYKLTLIYIEAVALSVGFLQIPHYSKIANYSELAKSVVSLVPQATTKNRCLV